MLKIQPVLIFNGLITHSVVLMSFTQFAVQTGLVRVTIIDLYSDFIFICISVNRYKVEVAGKSLPVLTNLDKGKYGVIVFENLNKYLQMDKWNRELLDKYCREYSVGIVGFIPHSEETLVGAQLKGFPLYIHTNLKLKVGSKVEKNNFQIEKIYTTTIFK